MPGMTIWKKIHAELDRAAWDLTRMPKKVLANHFAVRLGTTPANASRAISAWARAKGVEVKASGITDIEALRRMVGGLPIEPEVGNLETFRNSVRDLLRETTKAVASAKRRDRRREVSA